MSDLIVTNLHARTHDRRQVMVCTDILGTRIVGTEHEIGCSGEPLIYAIILDNGARLVFTASQDCVVMEIQEATT